MASNLLPPFHSGKKSVTEDGGELHVLIKEANNLIAMKATGTSDTFVKGLDFILSSLLSVSLAPPSVSAYWLTSVIL